MNPAIYSGFSKCGFGPGAGLFGWSAGLFRLECSGFGWSADGISVGVQGFSLGVQDRKTRYLSCTVANFSNPVNLLRGSVPPSKHPRLRFR